MQISLRTINFIYNSEVIDTKLIGNSKTIKFQTCAGITIKVNDLRDPSNVVRYTMLDTKLYIFNYTIFTLKYVLIIYQ